MARRIYIHSRNDRLEKIGPYHLGAISADGTCRVYSLWDVTPESVQKHQFSRNPIRRWLAQRDSHIFFQGQARGYQLGRDEAMRELAAKDKGTNER